MALYHDSESASDAFVIYKMDRHSTVFNIGQRELDNKKRDKFYVHGTVHPDIVLQQNKLDAQFSSLLNITLHVSDGFFFTVAPCILTH